VIGNSAYRHVGALANLRNDAFDIAASFERLGFSVRRLIDSNLLIERKPATADVFREYLSRHPKDGDDPDDDDLDAELDRLFAAD